MALQAVDLGSGPNTHDGDPLRWAFTKINGNFDEVEQRLGVQIFHKIGGYTEIATTGDVVIMADKATNMTIVMPSAVNNTARITVKKVQATGLVTIDGVGAETIEGGATAVLTDAGEAITMVSDLTNWVIV